MIYTSKRLSGRPNPHKLRQAKITTGEAGGSIMDTSSRPLPRLRLAELCCASAAGAGAGAGAVVAFET
ncbi:hypothetical protein VTL71DRAFT_8791 [Oculimacula yallundae]|uniref:Uncharacterized protein n=1 Tax=Oculimacula yallundae TaxID=86028 RepID=A0ABR4CYR6_9HELO